jgi:hypothetical protein
MATMSGSGRSPGTPAGGVGDDGGPTAGEDGCARAIAVKASRRSVAARIVRSSFAINLILDSPGLKRLLIKRFVKGTDSSVP